MDQKGTRIMPLFNYICKDCGNHVKKLFKQREESVDCPECGKTAIYHLSGDASVTFMELKDPYRGVSIKKDNEKQLKARMKDHHNRFEIAEKVDKFGFEEAQKNGWDKKYKRI